MSPWTSCVGEGDFVWARTTCVDEGDLCGRGDLYGR
jgi:hypothetical protein